MWHRYFCLVFWKRYGTADVSGYRYILSGTVAGTTATGTLNDPQTGGNIPFTAKINDQLILTLHMSDPFTGQTKSVVCEFQRGVVLQETDTTADSVKISMKKRRTY